MLRKPFAPPSTGFSAFRYQQHNQRRQEHLATLGLDLFDKTVLEVGAGIGDHTSFFLDRGCTVVCTEAREENLRLLRSRFPGIEVFQQDLENPSLPALERDFDVVYCYGLLYHLRTPGQTLAYLAARCSGLLLLETCVSFATDVTINLIDEDRKKRTQSYSGTGCRPTRQWVFAELKKHFPFVYMPVTQPNHFQFPLDWTVPPPDNQLIRSVFIGSRAKLINPVLMETIPMHQTKSS
ncbi:MAG: class I SAM-dependent methyltransferase [Thermodesulfobacteriota bacterium]